MALEPASACTPHIWKVAFCNPIDDVRALKFEPALSHNATISESSLLVPIVLPLIEGTATVTEYRAQEVERVLPEVVYETTNPEQTETFKAVRYGNMVGLLIEAIKELSAEIEELKAR